MSTEEYNDLFLKCQNKGKYHMFVFDMIGSKNMTRQYRYEAQDKMVKLMDRMYKTIEQIQESTNRKILVFDDDFVTFKSGLPYKGFGFKQEPFLFADTFGFTIYKGSLDKEIIYSIYEYFKSLLQIDFDFHITDGYYETNDWVQGHDKYFRGYCIDLLSNLHKDYNKEVRKALQKQKRI